MKMKKSQFRIEVVIIAAFVLIILVVFITIFTGKVDFHKFNPDEGVCLGTDDVIINSEFPTKKYDDYYCRMLNISELVQYPLSNMFCSKCIDWRPKTICEKNPEAEGCICDEYKIYIEQGGCIKSHLPNECEKGNEDYILDCNDFITEYINCTNETIPISACIPLSDTNGEIIGEDCGPPHNFTLQKNCSKTKICINEICRKKTIYDYSCDELKFKIINEDYDHNWFNMCTPNCHLQEKFMLIAFIEKGCEI